MPFDSERYVRQILATRRRHLAIDREYDAVLLRLLRLHADDLAHAILRFGPDAERETVRRIVLDLYATLRDRVHDETRTHVMLSYRDIKRELDRITREAVLEAGRPAAFLPRPAVTQAAAYVARGSVARTFRTLDTAVMNAGQAVDDMIAEAFIRGWSPERLARKLRPFVLGRSRFTSEELKDLRRVPHHRRESVRQLRYRTRRIAFTEMGNATHEAQVQNMIEAPMAKAARWRLSPVRGTQQGKPDECDILAFHDTYGLGDGVFPVKRIPPRPHPFDRCWLQSVARPPEEWEERKPDPDIKQVPTVANTQDIMAGVSITAHQTAVLQARRAIYLSAKRRAA